MANPQTLTIEAATQSLPMVLIAKEDKEALGTMLMRAIRETCVLSGTTLDADTISIFAEQLIINFPQYRFEEIVMALRNGVNGKYKADKQQSIIFGELKYTDLTNWINEYDAERERYFVDKRIKESAADKSNVREGFLNMPQHELEKLANVFKLGEAKREVNNQTAYGGTRLRQQWDERESAIFLKALAAGLSDEQLNEYLYSVDDRGYVKTKQLILNEIEHRKNKPTE